MASNPYASAIQTTETPREREYRLLARANAHSGSTARGYYDMDASTRAAAANKVT